MQPPKKARRPKLPVETPVAPAPKTYKVKRFEVRQTKTTDAVTGRPVTIDATQLVDQFGVQAPSDDLAKKVAEQWLREQGYQVRSISFSTEPRILIAYVLPKETPAKTPSPTQPKAVRS